MTDTTEPWEAWLHALPPEWVRAWQEAAPAGATVPASLGSELAALGWALLELDTQASPAAACQRLRAALTALRARLHTAAPGMEQFSRWLDTLDETGSAWPGLGPLQVAQADRARLERAATRYARALTDWSQRLLPVAEESIAEFSERLDAEQTERGAAALMDLWCDIAETRYETALDSPDYAKAYAELVNAGSELRLAWAAVLDPVLAGLGLPSRSALEDTQRRLDQLAREQRRSIAELRQQLDGLGGGNGGRGRRSRR